MTRLPSVRDRLRPPREDDFTSPAHDARVTSRIGLWLAAAFVLCLFTGVLSHAIQHPPSWFGWPSRPSWLYRVTQGTHVLSGIAAIPLLLAKLWSVYPKLFGRPLVRDPVHALERGSILLLSGSAFFQLGTGLFNVAQNYVWGFSFPAAHYAVSWVAVGSIAVHVAVKLPVIRAAIGRSSTSDTPAGPDRDGLVRRRFLRTGALVTGAAVVATAGATVTPLRWVSPLSWRGGRGPQGLPVNRTAAAAGVLTSAADPAWRLELVAGRRRTLLSLADLGALPQTTAELPIACVEGWSQSASWTGVAVADLLRATGAEPGTPVRVTSLEQGSPYGSTVLPGVHTADPLTLLALRLDGEPLDIDHGYPCRIIAPNRPGVLQTKWVGRLEVLT